MNVKTTAVSELDDIFHYPEKQLYQEVGDLKRSYKKLRGRFDEFVGHIKSASFPVRDAEVKSGPDGMLLVGFCGKEFRFHFHMIKSGDLGEVRCLVTSDGDTDEVKLLATFTFNGQGETNIIAPGSRDSAKLVIHEEASAHGIVAHLFLAGFADNHS
jgi:hypothetical protein